jgi:hypothetical protein
MKDKMFEALTSHLDKSATDYELAYYLVYLFSCSYSYALDVVAEWRNENK